MRATSRYGLAALVVFISFAAAMHISSAPLHRVPPPTALVARRATPGASPVPALRIVSAQAFASAGTPAPSVPPPIAASALAADVDDMARNIPAHLGLMVAKPDGTVLAQVDPDTQMEAASLYKLAIMVEVFRQRESGDLHFSDQVTLYPGFFTEEDPTYGDGDVDSDVTVQELLTNMITISSNVAANALLYAVGTSHVNATMSDLGLTSTEIRWSPQANAGQQASTLLAPPLSGHHATLAAVPAFSPNPPLLSAKDAYNVTSPRDLERLFQLLLAGKVVSAQASSEMLGLLAQQEINDRLPAGLPAGTKVAHKTGNVDDVIHDAGIIYGPKGPIIVVAMSENVDNQDDVVEFMTELGRLAYGAME